MSSDNEAVLEFTISIKAKLDPESKATLEELQKSKENIDSLDSESKQKKQEQENDQEKQDDKNRKQKEEVKKDEDEAEQQKKNQQSQKPGKVITEGNLDDFQDTDFFKDQGNELSKQVADTLNKLDAKGLQTLSNFASNPTSATLSALGQVLTLAGPEGTALLAIVGLAVSAPEVVAKIVNVLSQKGGPLNRDYQIVLDQQINVGLSKLIQKRTQVGLDQVIISQQKGYTPNNEAWTYNSYFQITDQRLARIGLTDRGSGVALS